jgi:macrodomain Ter protein organizer (MatP/YcbG family)
MACSYTTSVNMTPGGTHVSQSLMIVFSTALYYNTPTLWVLCRAPSSRVSSAEIIRLRSLSVFLGCMVWIRLATVAPRRGWCYGTRKAQYGHETVAR